MPLVAWGALAYGAGLLFALTTPTRVALGGVLVALAAVLAARAAGRTTAAACATLMAGGSLAALASAESDRRCAQRVAGLGRWTARMDGDGSPGAVVRATLLTGSCRVRATLVVRSGNARSGDRAVVEGRPSLDSRGMLVRDATLSGGGRAWSLAVLRARAGARIDRIFGEDAALVRALVIADMSGIPAEERERFARAGLVHMLSVSGLHVAIIALALELLAGVLRIPPTPARLVTLVLLALYVAGIGAPAPAVRAAVMLGMLVACRILQRPTSPWAVVAIGSAAPLASPRTVLDLGWQLSVAGTVALVAGGTVAGRLLPRTWRGPRRSLARALAVSMVATLVTAPLVAWSFGRVALIGPLSNVLADPVMALLQPVLFVALCIPVPAVERLAADAAHALIAVFEAVAVHAASVPGGAPLVLPTTLAACVAAVAALAVVVACMADRPVRAVMLALSCLVLLIVEPLAIPRRGRTELHVLDVGQGDALAIRTRAGRWIVVDAGRVWSGGDAGRRTLVPYVTHRGGSVALFVLSHPHADHVGGAASLLSTLRPARFLDPGYRGTTPSYLAALEVAREARIPWQRVRPGDSLVVDEVVLTALAPDSSWAAELEDANLASTVLLARAGGVRMLLTGDAEAAEEAWLLAQGPEALAADVLKVAHHGSATSSTTPFLDAVRPRLALVSVGAHNTYGHPSPSVLDALALAGADVLRTDLVGTIVVRTDGRALEVEARGMRWTLPERELRLP